MTRLVPPDARPAVWGSADVDGSGVGEALARLGACSELGCLLATAADAAPVRNHRTRIRRGLFEGAARAFLETKARRRLKHRPGHVPTFKVLPPPPSSRPKQRKSGLRTPHIHYHSASPCPQSCH